MANLPAFFSSAVHWDKDDVRLSKLSVRIVRGMNVPSGNLGSDSYDYVEMRVANPSGPLPSYDLVKTDMVKNSQNPKWNFESSFDLQPDQSSPEERFIVLCIFNWDRIGDPVLLAVTKIGFTDILVEHAGRKKHKLALSHPSKRVSGHIIIDTAITCEMLKFLAHLKISKPAAISLESAKSMAEAMPYSPLKLASSDLPLWLVTEYVAPLCYNQEDSSLWRDAALSILKPCYPLSIPSNISAEKAKIVNEANILHYLGKEKDSLGDKSSLIASYESAVSFTEKGKDFLVLFYSTLPALSGFPAAERLFVSSFKSLFGEYRPAEAAQYPAWENLFTDTNTASNTAQFTIEMKLSKEALRAVKAPSDLDAVSQHLASAKLYSHDPNVTLLAALFLPSDLEIFSQIRSAANQGSTDAKKLVSLLEQNSNSWSALQKSCYDFQRLLVHVREYLLDSREEEESSPYRPFF